MCSLLSGRTWLPPYKDLSKWLWNQPCYHFWGYHQHVCFSPTMARYWEWKGRLTIYHPPFYNKYAQGKQGLHKPLSWEGCSSFKTEERKGLSEPNSGISSLHYCNRDFLRLSQQTTVISLCLERRDCLPTAAQPWVKKLWMETGHIQKIAQWILSSKLIQQAGVSLLKRPFVEANWLWRSDPFLLGGHQQTSNVCESTERENQSPAQADSGRNGTLPITLESLPLL